MKITEKRSAAQGAAVCLDELVLLQPDHVFEGEADRDGGNEKEICNRTDLHD